MRLKPVTSEKAVKMLDIENTLVFETEREMGKDEIKAEVEKIFNVKVEKIRSMIRKNKKIAFVKLDKKNPAADVATKMGVI